MKKKTKIKVCRHALAVHEGHGLIYFDEANKELLTDACCGGVILFKYCPFCGENIHEWNRKILETTLTKKWAKKQLISYK